MATVRHWYKFPIVGMPGNERMEFYPDQLGRLGLYDEAVALLDNASALHART